MFQEFSIADSERSVLDNRMAEAQEKFLYAQELMSRVSSLEESAESENGEVFITVDNSGGLLEIELADSAMELEADDLAELIMETFQDAHYNVTESYTDLVYDEFGEDSAIAQAGIAQMRGRLLDEGEAGETEMANKAISSLWRR